MPYGQNRSGPTAFVELVSVFEHQLTHGRLTGDERLVVVTDSTFCLRSSVIVDGEPLLSDGDFVPLELR